MNRDEIVFTVPYVDENNCITHQRIVDVVKLPKLDCYKVTTATGKSVIVNQMQKFRLQNGQCKTVEDLNVGDKILIHNGTRFTKQCSPRKKYAEVYVKYHPLGKTKIVDGKYRYCRVLVSHSVYEAHMNGLSYEEYLKLLNMGDEVSIQKLRFIDTTVYDIHHKDLNSENNSLDNLEMLTKTQHGRIHAMHRKENLSFIAVADEVVGIDHVETIDSYAIICSKCSNYVANDFVIECEAEY